MLIVLFIYFQSKSLYTASGRSGCFEFWLWCSFTILLSKMKWLFFSLWKFSSCHFWNHKSVFLQILNQYWLPSNITPLYFFSFGQKQSIKMQIFLIFKCSGQNSSNSSCQFWNGKSIPLRILHHFYCNDTLLVCKF